MLTLGASSWVLPFERRSQLVVLLGLAGAWVARREAAATLWPEAAGPAAATSLRKTLFRLAQVPWGACVQSEGGALRLDADCDLAAFQDALRDARLDDALALWQGDPLAGFDDDANEAWSGRIRFERDRLRADWRGAALRWLDGEVPAAAAVDLSARLMQSDPWDEASLLAQVRWLERSGQAGAARAAHERFVARVRDELGVTPSTGLLAAGRAPDARAPEPRAPIRTARGSAAIDGDFVGRTAELRSIASLLEADDGRLVTLLGPGGVGKTRLARRALQELSAGFADGALFVALDDLAAAGEVGARLARELGLADGDAPLERALQHLAARRMLVVLDNFEQLDPGEVRPDRWLERCPGLKLLVTSRARLGLPGEQLLPIEGLPCPEPEDADVLDTFDAVRLFVRCVHRLDPGFRPAAEAPHVIDICRRVGGLPLALELAASWTRVLGCEAIAAELSRGTDLLTSGDPGRPQRHASIEAVFEQSWRLLTGPERTALARLSVFRGGFAPEAARAVAGAAPPVLAALADKSLLHKDGSRLALHPLVQQLSAARLSAAGQSDDAARAHARHYRQLMEHHAAAVFAGARDALRLIDLEFENCRAAWRHAAGAGDADGLAQCVWTIADFCDHRGRIADGLALIEEALAALPPAARGASAILQVRAAAAHLVFRLDRYAEAHAMAEAVLAAAQPRDDADVALHALTTLGSAAMQLGRLGEAALHYREHLRRMPPESDPHRAARTYLNLAVVEKAAGRYDEALAMYGEALLLHQRFSDPASEARCLHNLALLHLSRGEMDAAKARLDAALARCEQHGYATVRAHVLGALVEHARLCGDFEAARRHVAVALPLAHDLGLRAMVCWLHMDVAHIALHTSELAEAQAAIGRAARLALEIDRVSLQLGTASVHADWLAARGDAAAACRVGSLLCAHPGTSAPDREALEARMAQWKCAAAGAAPEASEPSPDAQRELVGLLRRLATGIEVQG